MVMSEISKKASGRKNMMLLYHGKARYVALSHINEWPPPLAMETQKPNPNPNQVPMGLFAKETAPEYDAAMPIKKLASHPIPDEKKKIMINSYSSTCAGDMRMFLGFNSCFSGIMD